MSITNTTEKMKHERGLGFLIASLAGGTSAAIEAQEAQGQRELAQSQMLPTKMEGCRPMLEAMGFVFLGQAEGDPLFQKVSFPEGWSIKPTDHAMWSELRDNKDRVRGSMFYKAAFYDRDAFLRLSQRYSVKPLYDANYDRAGMTCSDAQSGTVFTAEPPAVPSYDAWNEKATECKAWLDSNYPDWQNAAAYWD